MAEPGNGATLHSYLVVLRRRKWWVIALALLGLGASLALSLTEPKQYSATAQLLVQSSGQSITLGSASGGVTPTDVQTDLQLATSAPVIRLVRGQLGTAPAISASEVDQTNVIALTAASSVPGRAALIANTYARAFVKQTQAAAISNLGAAQGQLQKQINSLGKQMKSLRGQQSAGAEVAALANQQSVLKEEIAQLQVNGAAATSGVEFVTPASVPSSPSSPKPSPGRPARARRRADTGSGGCLPAGQPRRRAVLQGSNRTIGWRAGHRDGADGHLVAQAEQG